MEILRVTKCLEYVNKALLLSLLAPAELVCLHSLWEDYVCILLAKQETLVIYNTFPVAFPCLWEIFP